MFIFEGEYFGNESFNEIDCLMFSITHQNKKASQSKTNCHIVPPPPPADKHD